MAFKQGDIVKHKGKFLRSIGWYTNVPIDGMVLSVKVNGTFDGWPIVLWCDEAGQSDGSLVNPANIMLAKDPDYS